VIRLGGDDLGIEAKGHLRVGMSGLRHDVGHTRTRTRGRSARWPVPVRAVALPASRCPAQHRRGPGRVSFPPSLASSLRQKYRARHSGASRRPGIGSPMRAGLWVRQRCRWPWEASVTTPGHGEGAAAAKGERKAGAVCPALHRIAGSHEEARLLLVRLSVGVSALPGAVLLSGQQPSRTVGVFPTVDLFASEDFPDARAVQADHLADLR
jgi:hypothetical protein